jgi:hypothetical protein
MNLRRAMIMICAFCAAFCCVQNAIAEPHQQTLKHTRTISHAFAPGEKLTYAISWSKIVDAGIAVMEVQEGPIINGNPTYHFVVSTHSVGVVEQFYPVRHFVESFVDANEMYSISFSLKESLGLNKKKRRREMTFDHKNNSVQFRLNDDPREVFSVPEHVQDALSSLYYVRSKKDFNIDKPITVDVFDSGKTWSVEVYTLGKERIETPLGEFDTIKVRTYPKYEGVFMNKGEIFIWLTDDEKKIPVLMKSTITIGSIVSTLTHIETGKISHDVKERIQTAQ